MSDACISRTHQVSSGSMSATVVAPVLGSVIRSARIDAGLTQTELADKVSVKQSTGAMWESGKQRLRSQQVIPVAKVLGIDPTALLAAVDAETAQ